MVLSLPVTTSTASRAGEPRPQRVLGAGSGRSQAGGQPARGVHLSGLDGVEPSPAGWRTSASPTTRRGTPRRRLPQRDRARSSRPVRRRPHGVRLVRRRRRSRLSRSTSTNPDTDSGAVSAACRYIRAPIEYPRYTARPPVATMASAHPRRSRSMSDASPCPGASTATISWSAARSASTGAQHHPVPATRARGRCGLTRNSARQSDAHRSSP